MRWTIKQEVRVRPIRPLVTADRNNSETMHQNEPPINSSSNRHEASANSRLRQNVIIDRELVDYEIKLNLDELGKGRTGEPFNISAVYCAKGLVSESGSGIHQTLTIIVPGVAFVDDRIPLTTNFISKFSRDKTGILFYYTPHKKDPIFQMSMENATTILQSFFVERLTATAEEAVCSIASEKDEDEDEDDDSMQVLHLVLPKGLRYDVISLQDPLIAIANREINGVSQIPLFSLHRSEGAQVIEHWNLPWCSRGTMIVLDVKLSSSRGVGKKKKAWAS